MYSAEASGCISCRKMRFLGKVWWFRWLGDVFLFYWRFPFFFKKDCHLSTTQVVCGKSELPLIQSIFTQIILSSSQAASAQTSQLHSYHPWDPILTVAADPSCKSREVKTRPKRGKVSQSVHTSQCRFGGRLPSVIHCSNRLGCMMYHIIIETMYTNKHRHCFLEGIWVKSILVANDHIF